MWVILTQLLSVVKYSIVPWTNCYLSVVVFYKIYPCVVNDSCLWICM